MVNRQSLEQGLVESTKNGTLDDSIRADEDDCEDECDVRLLLMLLSLLMVSFFRQCIFFRRNKRII